MKKSLICITLLSIILTGCGTTSEVEPSINMEDKMIRFIAKDSNTVKVSEYNKIVNYDNTENFENEEQDIHSVNELIISGNTDVTWQVTEDGSIVYNDITFLNLSNNVASVPKPCNDNVLIRFILESFKPSSDTVYCIIENYDLVGTEDNTSILEDELSSFHNYNQISSKYNDKVSWILTVYEYGMTHYGKIYGCKSFMICKDVGKDNIIEFTADTPEPTETVEPVEQTDSVETIESTEQTEPTESEVLGSEESINTEETNNNNVDTDTNGSDNNSMQ